ncbi:hypothetical protein KC480_06005 [Bacillus velezensis]|uniref:hypothetical protein n=1 Tax=Bacillus velezensis TaxID=492670 RepID=UPI001E2969AB|nr:hypothetical protein [Bacillus velezensis]MCD7911079.1 hypothetical protein [Bacillus velezensis]
MAATLIKDIDGRDFDLAQLQDLSVHSSVPLEDGTYITQDKEYSIQNHKLVEYWPLPHPNQLTLF